MSKFRVLNAALVGVQHIDQSSPPDEINRLPRVGGVIQGVDPYWGGGEFIYCKFVGAIRAKALVQFAPAFDATLKAWMFIASEAASTANSGRPVGVAVMPAADGTYGWVQISGITPVSSNTGLAANSAAGIGTVGQIATNTAGKQVNSFAVVNQSSPSSTTVVKPSTSAAYQAGTIGSNLIAVTNTDGWFVGGYVSGTGIAAGATVTAIDVSEQIVTLSANNTANVTGNITMTYNNGTVYYPPCVFDRPQIQGAIT